jgi:hypothetical protein
VTSLGTPFGELVSIDLDNPQAKYCNGGAFSVTLRLSAVDAAPLIECIDARMDSIFSITKNLRMSCPYDPQDDGTYLFHFRKPARTIDSAGLIQRHMPRVWDAKSRAWPKSHVVDLGSRVRVTSGFSHDYKGDAGVTLELIAVQTAEISSLPEPRRQRRAQRVHRKS